MSNNSSLQRVVLLSLSSLLLAFQFCFVCSLVCSLLGPLFCSSLLAPLFCFSGVGKGVSPFYIKDTKLALQIFDQIHFNCPNKFIFTMDIKSLHTVIPHRDGLEALKIFLNQRTLLEPSTTTLIRLAELVLTLNNFSFKGEHYQQISGVVMGTNMGRVTPIYLLVT